MIIKEFFHNKTKKNTDYKFSSVFAHFFSDEGINVIKLLSLDYETIGSLVYKFKSGMAWLYKIEVEKKYQSDGFGHLLMSLFEEDCAKNRIKTIPLKALNRLTPLAIAIWWMDDGSLCKKVRNGKVHAWELYLNTYLSKEENQIIIDYFQNKWNVKWNLNLSKGKYRLRCSTREGRKFLTIIRPIVSQIKCMQYKCLEI